MNSIEEYLNGLLFEQLKNLGLSNEQCEIVIDDIRKRLESLSSIIDDREQSASLLELSREEAINYEPKEVRLSIRQIVNLGIRNSILEDLNAELAFTSRLRSTSGQVISDEEMKCITKEAIRFFDGRFESRHEFGGSCLDFKSTHPITYKAFLELSKLASGTTKYQPVNASAFAIESKYDLSPELGSRTSTQVISGYDPTLDEHLSSAIYHIKQEKGTLYIPFFKFLTRNTKKLYDVFEILLAAGANVATLNYYLSNGVVCKRKRLIRVAHTTKEVEVSQKNLQGLSKKHKQVLKHIV